MRPRQTHSNFLTAQWSNLALLSQLGIRHVARRAIGSIPGGASGVECLPQSNIPIGLGLGRGLWRALVDTSEPNAGFGDPGGRLAHLRLPAGCAAEDHAATRSGTGLIACSSGCFTFHLPFCCLIQTTSPWICFFSSAPDWIAKGDSPIV